MKLQNACCLRITFRKQSVRKQSVIAEIWKEESSKQQVPGFGYSQINVYFKRSFVALWYALIVILYPEHLKGSGQSIKIVAFQVD